MVPMELYITSMTRSRAILSITALVALAGWANAQAMSCCWLPAALSLAGSTEVVIEAPEAPMAADHSCCAGATESPTEAGTDDPAGCGFGDSGTLAACCERADGAAVSAAVAVADVFPVSVCVAEYPGIAEELAVSPRLSLRSTASIPETGPPVYLAVQRFLI